ncbi:hypothetical protein [Tautonia plasticadhaerens]|uniref:hypothetical protein n=1 Tax=Tautonia plasticadhaerens TaxID=2527974 RepID=UPI001E3F1795|nr:hypothetical protein [Tautonia plasticadhaerens]
MASTIALILASTVFCVAARLPIIVASTAWISFGSMAVAGYLIMRAIVPNMAGSGEGIAIGAVVGLLSLRVVLACQGFLVGLSGPLSLVAHLEILAVAVVLDRRFGRMPGVTADDARAWRGVLEIATATILLMAIPYARVGGMVNNGFSFVPYFNKDFFQHAGVVSELTRSLPPSNPFFAGERLHYYWLSHLWPASLACLTGGTARDALVSVVPPNAFLFVCCLTALIRRFVPVSGGARLAVGIALFAPSYISLVYLTKLMAPAVFRLLPNASSLEYSGISHSWFRDLLYEPHAVTAMTMVVAAMMIDHADCGRTSTRVALLTGALLGLTALTDSFIGLIGAGWFACSRLRLLISDHSRVAWASTTAGLLAWAAPIAAGMAAGILPVGGRSPMTIAPHLLLKYAPAYLLVELGPLLIFGAVGTVVLVRRLGPGRVAPLAWLGLVSIVFMFFASARMDPDIALRKGLKTLQIPLVVAAGASCAAFLETGRSARLRGAGVLAISLGALTIATDMHHYLDLSSRRVPSPTVVGFEEMRMYDWIRKHTGRSDVFQLVDVVRPGRSFQSTQDLQLPALAERRTLFCNFEQPYIFHVTSSAIERRRHSLESVFTADGPDSLERALRDLPPHFLIVDEGGPGPVEAMRLLAEDGGLRERFRVGSYALYEVSLGRLAGASPPVAADGLVDR